MFTVTPGTTIYDQIPALEDDGTTKRSGLTLGGGDFVVTVYQDCVITALPVTITEIGGTGEYCIEYTPPSAGFWVVEIGVVFNGDCFKSSAAVGVAADISTVIENLNRALSLLHFNSIVDQQEYADPNGQITKWRHRGFNSAGNVPATAGGNETTGKIFEHEFEAEYDGPNQPSKLRMTKIQ